MLFLQFFNIFNFLNISMNLWLVDVFVTFCTWHFFFRWVPMNSKSIEITTNGVKSKCLELTWGTFKMVEVTGWTSFLNELFWTLGSSTKRRRRAHVWFRRSAFERRQRRKRRFRHRRRVRHRRRQRPHDPPSEHLSFNLLWSSSWTKPVSATQINFDRSALCWVTIGGRIAQR